MKTKYLFYASFLIFTMLDFATFAVMNPERETNPVWILLFNGQYASFAVFYGSVFLLVVFLTEALLKYSEERTPVIGFFAYSLLVFGCQAHFIGALSNLEAFTHIAHMAQMSATGAKMVQYSVLVALFLSPIPLSLVAFAAWQKHHGFEDLRADVNELAT